MTCPWSYTGGCKNRPENPGIWLAERKVGYKNVLHFLLLFESSLEASAKFEYYLRCPLDQLSCDPHRWRSLPVCNSALTASNRYSWGTGEHSGALPVYRIHKSHRQICDFWFQKIVKGY